MLRDLLSREFDRLNLTTKEVAEELSLKQSRVAAWRAGQRAPDKKQSEALAALLRPTSTDDQTNMVVQLTKAVAKFKLSMLDDLASGGRKLKFGSTSYSGGEGFLDTFLKRFLHIAGIDGEEISRDDDAISLKDQLSAGEVDLGLGLLATIDRALTIRFLTTPIRVGLNAVVLDESLSRRPLTPKQLRDALTQKTSVKDAQQQILPIVMKDEVGGTYIRKTLRFDPAMVDFVEKFQYTLYGKQLRSREQRFGGDSTARVPVAVLDEVTALYVLRYLQQEKRPARLIFSLDDSDSVKDEKKDLPEFLVSMSLNRKNTELIDYLTDALRLFLRTEIETIASYYVRFFHELETLAKETVSTAAARRWAEYTFGISEGYLAIHEDVDLPWSVILKRASMLRDQSKSLPKTNSLSKKSTNIRT
jgi:hypothetical protein